jgi:hypothetical protein
MQRIVKKEKETCAMFAATPQTAIVHDKCLVTMEKVASMVVHACNPSTLPAKAGRARVQGQPWLHCKILSQKKF